MTAPTEKYDGDSLGGATESMPNREFVRDLGALERLLQLYSIDHPRHFCVAAKIEGALSTAHIISAFERVQARHELLNVQIGDGHHGSKAFFRTTSPIAIVFKSADGLESWQHVVGAELARPFDPAVGPLLRATVLYGVQSAYFIFTFHHAIADGMAAVFIVRDLMTALEGIELHATASAPSLEQVYERVEEDWRAQGHGALVSKTDQQTLIELAGQPLWRDFQSDRPTVWSLQIGPALTDSLRLHAKENGTSVHGAVCASLIQSTAQLGSGEQYTILTPINVREHFGLAQDICGLYQGLGTTSAPLRREQDFWSTARAVTDSLAPFRARTGIVASIGKIAQCLPNSASKEVANGLFGSLRYDAVVSNLGILPIPEQLGSFKLSEFWGPMVQGRFKHERVFGVSTIGGKLRITQTSPDYLEPVLDQMHEVLRQNLLQ